MSLSLLHFFRLIYPDKRITSNIVKLSVSLVLTLFIYVDVQGRKIDDELNLDVKRSLEEEARLVIDLLQNYHFSNRPFGDLDPNELLIRYIAVLDLEAMIFTHRQVNFLMRRFERSMKASYLFKDDLSPAYEVFNSYVKNYYDRLGWIEERLEGTFDFEATDEFLIEVEAEESIWPKDKNEADEKWDKYLRFLLVNRMLVKPDVETAVGYVRNEFRDRLDQMNQMDPLKVIELFLSLLMNLYDPHSGYSSWFTNEEEMLAMGASLEGIGADLVIDEGVCVVRRIIPGGPADLSNQIFEDDQLLSLQSVDTDLIELSGLRLREVVSLIRGEPGSELILNVRSASSGNERSVALIRGSIDMASNRCKGRIIEVPTGDGVRMIGVISIPQFYGGMVDETEAGKSVTEDVRALIEKLTNLGMDGLVLDVRDNPGGVMSEASSLVGLFIEGAPTILVEIFGGNVDKLEEPIGEKFYSGPLAVLTSSTSASASEILAGTLSVYERALIVGERSTFGKGTMQSVRNLGMVHDGLDDDLHAKWGSVRTTEGRFFLPDGSSTQLKGAESDIVIDIEKSPDEKS